MLSPPEAEMPPKSNEMATDKHMNIHELILDYMCCHYQKLNDPKIKRMATDQHVNIYKQTLDYMWCHHQKLKRPLSQTTWRWINT